MAEDPRRIQFEQTRWGTVAHASIGTGPVLLVDTGWFSDLGSMWEQPGYRGLVEHLARTHTVVSYDPPGSGLSDRRSFVRDFDDEVAVLEHMLDRFGVSASRPASIFGASIAASTAVRYAAEHPDRVTRLVLFGATARGADLAPTDVRDALIGLIRAHWGLGSRAISDLFVPGLRGDDLEWFDRWQRDAVSPEIAAARLRMYYDIDITDACARVTSPCLVLHRSGDRAVPRALGVALASLLPSAELTVVGGDAHPPYLGDWLPIAEAVSAFLTGPAPPALTRGPYGELTAREQDVADLTVEGLTNTAIGDRLGISSRTVETHMTRIREKLGVGTRAEIAAWMARERDRP